MKLPNAPSLWRWLCLGAAILSGGYLLLGCSAGILGRILTWQLGMETGAASVGIIGGADGPTAIFVAAPDPLRWVETLCAWAVLILGLAAFVCLSRKKKEEPHE